MNDRIRELDVFLRVSEEASFSAAARSLDCNPSTISKLIMRMENRLGVRLFHRTSRALKLTQEGERFLEGAQRVIDALEDAENTVGQGKVEASGALRINCTLSFALYQLVPLIPEFSRRNPRLLLEFHLTAQPVDLFENQIDIAIQSGHIPDSSLIARRIATSRWIICASPAYLDRAGVPGSIDDLQSHACLNFLAGSYRSTWPVLDGEARRELEVRGTVATNSGDLLRSLALMGMGIARLAEFHVAADLAAGRLIPVLPEHADDLAEPIFAIYASKRHLSPRVKVLLDFLDEKFGAAKGWGVLSAT